jgi:predicted outer membrane protein
MVRTAIVAGFVIAATAVASTAHSLRAAPASKAALDDATIVPIFDATNTWDIETGALAEKKGTTKEVREFGAIRIPHPATSLRQYSVVGTNDFGRESLHFLQLRTALQE